MSELDRMFSDYRSEWIVDDFDERFVEPPYYHRFLDMRPTFLIGGRGTGKTIALRSLHFSNKDRDGKPRHLGIYVKAFKNRILAFTGRHLPDDMWLSAFQHYMNLLCCIELADLCVNIIPSTTVSTAQQNSIGRVCEYLSIVDHSANYLDLYDSLRTQLARLTKYVIAPKMTEAPSFALSEEPVVEFARDVHRMLGSADRPIYICIDEWENLSEGQQQVLNAWIKNSGSPISYKLGVRERGIKTRLTGNAEDPLASPGDYSEVSISGDESMSFCREVAEKRLKIAKNRNINLPDKLSSFLPRLGPAEEAEALGARELVEREAEQQRRLGREDLAQWLREAPLDQAHLAIHLQRRGLGDLRQIIGTAREDGRQWQRRIENYRYASLFTITRGRRGVAMRKIYAGAETFLKLSGGNVRYLLELLDEVVRVYSRDQESREHENNEHSSPIAIGYLTQTVGARNVAKRHVDQIQGLSHEGLRIARLVRSLGTVFYDLMRNPSNSAPEMTGFTVAGQQSDMEEANMLLQEGCAILALVAERATKLTSATETQQDEYRLHPILSPHFNISYRKKRRIRIDARELLLAAADFEGAKSLHSSVTGHPMTDTQLDLLST